MMKLISFANQKGGSGKTSTTKGVATWLHSYTNYRVIVVDVDLQQSFSSERTKDLNYLKLYRQSPVKNARVTFYDELVSLKGGPFPVISMPSVQGDGNAFVDFYEREKDNYDICLVDLPGNIESASVDKVLGYINHIFIPTDVDDQTISSSVDFGKAVMSLAKKDHLPNLLSIIYYFNKYTLNKNKSIFPSVMEDITQATSLPFLTNHLKEVNDMKMENSTIWPMRGSIDKDHFLFKFCLEIIENIK